MVERKCSSCGHWNKAEDYCVNCGAAVSPEAVEKERDRIRKEKMGEEKPSLLDVYREKAQTSKNPFVRIGFQILYSLAVFVGLIGAFLAWLTAMANA